MYNIITINQGENMNLKDVLNNISGFIVDLYQNHFALIVLFIVVFLILIILLSLLMFKRNNRATKGKASDDIQLTTEEIENISKNVSNPAQFKEMIEAKTLQTESVEERKTEDDKIPEVAVTKEEPVTPIITPKDTVVETSTPINETVSKRVYSGKWKISKDEYGFFAKLHASNGGLLLKTEHYTSMSGIKNGIETIKKNVEYGNFAISIDKNNHYHFKLFSKSNKLICVSEDYSSKAKCENAIASVKRFASATTIILEETND